MVQPIVLCPMNSQAVNTSHHCSSPLSLPCTAVLWSKGSWASNATPSDKHCAILYYPYKYFLQEATDSSSQSTKKRMPPKLPFLSSLVRGKSRIHKVPFTLQAAPRDEV